MSTPSDFAAELAGLLAHHWWIYVAFTVAAVGAAIGKRFDVCLFAMCVLSVLVAVQFVSPLISMIGDRPTGPPTVVRLHHS